MQAKDQHKVVAAGFTIIRKEVIHQMSHKFTRRIKAKTNNNLNWHTLYDDFTTTAALERKMKELLKHPNVIED